MSNYATISDLQELKRALTSAEQSRAEALIPLVCSIIRYEAQKTGRDFDDMIYRSSLVPCIDAFVGDGERTSFNLNYAVSNVINVTVKGIAVTDFETDGNTIRFNEAPIGEVLVTYEYRALLEVAKGVVCDVVMRELNTPSTQLPATTTTESAGNVSLSYSLPNSSGAIKLWPSDLKALGLKRQRIGALNLGNTCRR